MNSKWSSRASTMLTKLSNVLNAGKLQERFHRFTENISPGELGTYLGSAIRHGKEILAHFSKEPMVTYAYEAQKALIVDPILVPEQDIVISDDPSLHVTTFNQNREYWIDIRIWPSPEEYKSGTSKKAIRIKVPKHPLQDTEENEIVPIVDIDAPEIYDIIIS